MANLESLSPKPLFSTLANLILHQPFTCGNTVLTSPLTIKDLGIIVDPQLKFTNHILEIVKKANQRAALIHRSFLSKTPLTSYLLTKYMYDLSLSMPLPFGILHT